MVGEDQTNKPDLRATPEPDSDAEAGQKDAPLPAFIYGRDGHGDGNGRGDPRSRDRQNFNARIADMDRKTLLGLVTGAGMLGLVLFFAGMLVGAGLFMDSEDTTVSVPAQKAPVEMLSSEPDAPTEPVVMTEPVPEPATPVEEPEIAADSDDPVGDLIAQRTEALSGQGETTSETASSDAAAMTETADTDASSTSSIAAPEIRDVAKAADMPEAPAAPEVAETAEATPEAAEQAEPAAEAEEAAPAPTETAAKPAPPAETPAATAQSADKPFSVQIGAFKVHENASQRAEELRKKGLQVAVVVRGPENDAAWYYVRIGAYASLAAARDDAAKIKKDHAIDGFPVRAEPNDREVN